MVHSSLTRNTCGYMRTLRAEIIIHGAGKVLEDPVGSMGIRRRMTKQLSEGFAHCYR